MTRQERLQHKLAARDRQLALAAEFAKKVVSPILANILEDGRTAAFPMTLRDVRAYGVDAVRVFRLMFKLLNRGGRTDAGIGFKSNWVVNPVSLAPFIEWTQQELPLKDLHVALVERGATELAWDKRRKAWYDKAIRAAAVLHKKRVTEKTRTENSITE